MIKCFLKRKEILREPKNFEITKEKGKDIPIREDGIENIKEKHKKRQIKNNNPNSKTIFLNKKSLNNSNENSKTKKLENNNKPLINKKTRLMKKYRSTPFIRKKKKRPIFSKIADQVDKDRKKYILGKNKKSKLDNSEVYYIEKEKDSDNNSEFDEDSDIEENHDLNEVNENYENNDKNENKYDSEISDDNDFKNYDEFDENNSKDDSDLEEEKLKIQDYLLNESKSKTRESGKGFVNKIKKSGKKIKKKYMKGPSVFEIAKNLLKSEIIIKLIKVKKNKKVKIKKIAQTNPNFYKKKKIQFLSSENQRLENLKRYINTPNSKPSFNSNNMVYIENNESVNNNFEKEKNVFYENESDYILPKFERISGHSSYLSYGFVQKKNKKN